MSTILDRIMEHKKLEVRHRMSESPEDHLKKSSFFNRSPLSLKESLLKKESAGIIAEFKRMSPSAGWIKRNANPVDITKGYVRSGASALSVLTDRRFFSGTLDDLIKTRENNDIPILRKDFIFHPYQVLEAKSSGADAILLIASVLDKSGVRELAIMAHEIGLEVLLEVHEPSELAYLDNWIDIVGVNNRNLKKMETDAGTSFEMADLIPDEYVKISESGIHDPETIVFLRKHGYTGFLIGEYFMRHNSPPKACGKFIREIKQVKTSG